MAINNEDKGHVSGISVTEESAENQGNISAVSVVEGKNAVEGSNSSISGAALTFGPQSKMAQASQISGVGLILGDEVGDVLVMYL